MCASYGRRLFSAEQGSAARRRLQALAGDSAFGVLGSGEYLRWGLNPPTLQSCPLLSLTSRVPDAAVEGTRVQSALGHREGPKIVPSRAPTGSEDSG